MIAALADAIRGSARRRRVRAWVVGGVVAIGSAAAAAALSFGAHRAVPDSLAHAPAPAAQLPRPAVPSGFTIAGPDGAPVTPGETRATRAESLALSAADGTSVRVGPGSEITLVRADTIRWFQLLHGSIEAHVAKLAVGERFVIATPDRQVEVHGTRFHVSLVAADQDCGHGTVTRVRVEEGVVTVRASGSPEERIEAGAVWPAECPPHAPLMAAQPAAIAVARPHRAPAPPAAARAPAPAPAHSTLGAENDLFAAAARAARAGDAPAALRALDELVTRYPASPLRAPAEAERVRLLGRAAPPAAPIAP
jgi:hypothetical protein